MDHLFYDLVEEIVAYLPRKDVETIARVADGRQGLEHWSAAAEGQLENRFLVDVTVVAGQTDDGVGINFLTIQKILSEGRRESWNFLNWRFAWMRSVQIEAYPLLRQSTADMNQVLRSISLPVDPSARGSLVFYLGPFVADDRLIPFRYDSDPEVSRLAWKILQAAQKDFPTVNIHQSAHISHEAYDEFVNDFRQRGAFVETLRHP
uniref:DUF5051 domain-containing protein n=1 Tax=Steinernema glaseri TaxID=37863 RepID=A0A1I8A8M6_9BILA